MELKRRALAQSPERPNIAGQANQHIFRLMEIAHV